MSVKHSKGVDQLIGMQIQWNGLDSLEPVLN